MSGSSDSNPQSSTLTAYSAAVVGVRLVALATSLWGGLALIKAIIDFAEDFNSAYILFFTTRYLLFPLICIIAGFLLCRWAPGIASRITKKL